MTISIRYRGQLYPVSARVPDEGTLNWWIEYTVLTDTDGVIGSTPKALRRTLLEAVHFARWIQAHSRAPLRDDIAIFPVDARLRGRG